MTIFEEACLGLPISCPIIDAHTHIGPYYLSGWHQKYDKTDTKDVLSDLSKLGIDVIVTTPHYIVEGAMPEANIMSAKAIEEFNGKLYAYIAVVPAYGMDEVKNALNTYSKNPGFVGLKFLSGYYQGPLTSKEYQYALDFANEMHCPVLCHVWDDNPSHVDVENLLKTRHNLKFILAHQGGGSAKCTRLVTPIINNYENAYLELCGSMNNQYGVEHIVDLVGENKVIFGTDAINLEPKYELGKVAFSPLSDDVKKKIFAENYLRILSDSYMGKITL